MSETQPHPYDALTPDALLDAVELAGYLPDGTLLALNSYENRVYQIGLDDAPPLIGKFYRPERWSDAAIREEHRFTLALQQDEVPVVAPLSDSEGETLLKHHGFRFALFPRRGGRWPELEDPDNLEWLGRFLGRIHRLGSTQPFSHRPTLNSSDFGTTPIHYLLDNHFIPLELESRYRALTSELIETIDRLFAEVSPAHIRLHGDCHPGNILWTEQGPHFVDMDDCRMGPAIQDLWMLLSGDQREIRLQLEYLLEGYEMFQPFDRRQVVLIEPLRTLRLIHYAAWLARRWDDPAFPKAFPWFNSVQYWQEHLVTLEHQKVQLELAEQNLCNVTI